MNNSAHGEYCILSMALAENNDARSKNQWNHVATNKASKQPRHTSPQVSKSHNSELLYVLVGLSVGQVDKVFDHFQNYGV